MSCLTQVSDGETLQSAYFCELPASPTQESRTIELDSPTSPPVVPLPNTPSSPEIRKVS